MRDILNLFGSYSGFSTFDAERQQSWARYDIELIKRDLMNHFQTRIGERVMRPDFGCRIWDWLMEPMTPLLREMIVNETIRVCQTDARVALQDVRVLEFENGIRIECTLNYVGFDAKDTFTVDFEARDPYLGTLMET